MPRLNRKIILSNIKEAREELEKIEKLLEDKKLSEIDLQIRLEHSYHHLNFAWNIRHSPTKNYANLSDEDFNRWSGFPKEIKPYKLKISK
jgi:hypothetical protein